MSEEKKKGSIKKIVLWVVITNLITVGIIAFAPRCLDEIYVL